MAEVISKDTAQHLGLLGRELGCGHRLAESLHQGAGVGLFQPDTALLDASTENFLDEPGETVPLLVVHDHQDVRLGLTGRDAGLVVGAAVDPGLALLDVDVAVLVFPFVVGMRVGRQIGDEASVELDVAGGFTDEADEDQARVSFVGWDGYAEADDACRAMTI